MWRQADMGVLGFAWETGPKPDRDPKPERDGFIRAILEADFCARSRWKSI
jgi:hypothetical protein